MTDPARDTRESTSYKVGNLQLTTKQHVQPVIPNQVTIFTHLLSFSSFSHTHSLPLIHLSGNRPKRNSITLQNYSTRGARNRSRLSFSVHFSSTGWRSRRGETWSDRLQIPLGSRLIITNGAELNERILGKGRCVFIHFFFLFFLITVRTDDGDFYSIDSFFWVDDSPDKDVPCRPVNVFFFLFFLSFLCLLSFFFFFFLCWGWSSRLIDRAREREREWGGARGRTDGIDTW